jgi:hypothetical protein
MARRHHGHVVTLGAQIRSGGKTQGTASQHHDPATAASPKHGQLFSRGMDHSGPLQSRESNRITNFPPFAGVHAWGVTDPAQNFGKRHGPFKHPIRITKFSIGHKAAKLSRILLKRTSRPAVGRLFLNASFFKRF